MRILFLDDDEMRHRAYKRTHRGHAVVHVYTAQDAIAALTSDTFDLASLDHDLGQGMGVSDHSVDTGYDVALFIAGELPPERVPKIIVIHSLNPVGAKAMFQLLARHTPDDVNVVMEPFGT